MSRSIPLRSLGALVGAAGWLAACSDPTPLQTPAQPPQASLQKAPTTAKVAPQPDPVV
ncbi:MAG: hypothetical protein JWO72_559, partial [Caulobacteraceae bacterium]|nr:hypothetical protein [Caulobacteraceae bacterium]